MMASILYCRSSLLYFIVFSVNPAWYYKYNAKSDKKAIIKGVRQPQEACYGSVRRRRIRNTGAVVGDGRSVLCQLVVGQIAVPRVLLFVLYVQCHLHDSLPHPQSVRGQEYIRPLSRHDSPHQHLCRLHHCLRLRYAIHPVLRACYQDARITNWGCFQSDNHHLHGRQCPDCPSLPNVLHRPDFYHRAQLEPGHQNDQSHQRHNPTE